MSFGAPMVLYKAVWVVDAERFVNAMAKLTWAAFWRERQVKQCITTS